MGWAENDIRRLVAVDAHFLSEYLRDRRTLYPYELDDVLVSARRLLENLQEYKKIVTEGFKPT